MTELKNGEWLPANDVELKIAVKRLLGNLPIGDEETYTTNSTGSVTAEFKRDSLFGDDKGNYTLIAWTESNELYGNIFVEKNCKLRIVLKKGNPFNKRSTWATRSKKPFRATRPCLFNTLKCWGTLI